ncbi:MAG: asparagine synthase-related protein [bacterium]
MQLDASDDQIREVLQELHINAIRIGLRADVPVGSYFSGGLDSSAMAALVANYFNNKVRTFARFFISILHL